MNVHRCSSEANTARMKLKGNCRKAFVAWSMYHHGLSITIGSELLIVGILLVTEEKKRASWKHAAAFKFQAAATHSLRYQQKASNSNHQTLTFS